MAIAIITGAGGLIGFEASRFFIKQGYQVVGIDNDMRSYFFGPEASTSSKINHLKALDKNFRHARMDIRSEADAAALFTEYGTSIDIIIHTAAQPSHDWAAKEPCTDFTVNANGTLNLLEQARQHCPDATFIFTSTNKVYGDTPNRLPLIETDTRWEIDAAHPYFEKGIDESMSIDQTLHSLFGASKVAADVLVQEYGKYFGMKTACFRGGCLTGPGHAGAKLHGFLSYLVKCAVSGTPYQVLGYKGKQVRDNIHSYDLVNAFWHFHQQPRSGEVYNMGGSRFSNCSVLEAIQIIEQCANTKMNWTYEETNRIGDHMWWVSDISKFKSHYPDWDLTYDVPAIIKEIIAAL
ncbi:MAG: NAD-dependent epimerase/dehydratase family protein [Spartobacteria bacterium]|nr:NAD-dependent epimerase/dehydratase family protein [Spartobacteria bacterium]